MDPVTAFGVAAAAFQFTDICARIVLLIKNAQESAGHALDELAVIAREVDTIHHLCNSVEQVFKDLEDFKTKLPQKEQRSLEVYEHGCIEVVRATRQPLTKLTDILVSFQPANDAELESKIHALKMLLKGHRRKDDIQRLHREVTAGRDQLRTYYSALSIIHLLRSYNLTTSYINEVSKDVNSVSGKVGAVVEQVRVLSFQLQNERRLVDRQEHPVDGLLKSVELNQHFRLLQSAETFYKGRDDLMTELWHAFHDSQASHQSQKRFVLYGFPGTGKTEFANKFAEKYKNSFWGIFAIDAASHVHAVSSFCRIAKYVAGKDVENDINAAKQWLADCKYPWLLIIDNADDTELDIKDYYPPGNTGCVLITTRNWSLRSQGNVGKRYYNFQKLDKTAAKQVLMSVADEEPPWTPEVVAAADKISDELHCLPLALVFAGRTIHEKLCTWKSYIEWYNDTRKTYSQKGTSPTSASDERSVKLTIIPTFESLLRRLDKSKDQTSVDALQLIYTFSYLHYSNIPISLLRKAVKNPHIDGLASTNNFPDHGDPPSETLQMRLGKAVLDVANQYEWLYVGALPLPNVLKSRKVPGNGKGMGVREPKSNESDRSDPEPVDGLSSYERSPVDERRLRAALSLLESIALITCSSDERDPTYSLHPLVHTWIRERIPQTWRRAIWCEAAAQTLSQCIVLESKAFAGQAPSHFDPAVLLPHVESLRKYQAEIAAEFVRYRGRRNRWSWPPVLYPEPGLITRLQTSQRLVRYSLVYSQMGRYKDAAKLQVEIQDRAVKRFGMNHERVIQISLVLAETMRNLGEFTESCRIQGEVAKACEVVYGPNHFTTFENYDRLGLLLLYGGRLLESKNSHQRALDGFRKLEAEFSRRESADNATQKVYSDFATRCRKQTLVAQCHMGAVQGRYLKWEESKVMIEEALEGLESLVPDDDEVIWAKENLAFTCCELEDLASRQRAHDLMVEVRDEREKRLGRQSPFTLWASVNLGRALWKLGRYDEALEKINYARELAILTLGVNHFGVLVGETVRGGVLIDKGEYDEAYKTLTFVDRELEKISVERGVDHLDRVVGLRYQMNLFELKGELNEAIAVGQKILNLLKNINKEGRGVSHPFYSIMVSKIEGLEKLASSNSAALGSANLSTQEQVRRRTIRGEASPSRGGIDSSEHVQNAPRSLLA